MTIQADVRSVATHFGVDPALLQAVVNAEGNILRAVQVSLPTVQTRDKALEVTCRSMVHALRDYVANQGLNGGTSSRTGVVDGHRLVRRTIRPR